MRSHELNHVRISNPDGLYRKYDEPNKVSIKNMRHKSIREDSSRSVRETLRVAESRERRRVEGRKRRKKRDGVRKASRGASMAGHALLIFTAVVFCSVVYVSSLTIRVRPCSSMATALAFQTWFRNPDETPLRATLYSEQDSYSKDFVGVAYLLFEGLERETKYALSIANLETEEKIYSATFLTAKEDPYQIRVEDPLVTEEGLFQFSLAIGGMEEGTFYTVYVMDENGKTVSVTDHSDAETTFSIPIKSLAASGDAAQLSGDAQASGDAQTSGGAGQQSGDAAQASDAAQPSGDAQTSDGDAQASGETAQTSDGDAQASGGAQTSGDAAQASGGAQPSGGAAPKRDMDALPFVTVKVNGKTFLPRVWKEDSETVPQPVAESVAETPETPDADKVEWVWNEERTEVAALAPDPEHPGQTVRLDAEFTETIAKEPDCTEAGLAVYELSAVAESGAEYRGVETEVIPPKGHRYERVRLDETQNGAVAEYVCDGCGKIYRVDASATEEPDSP